jgi:uncharacterized damage-inducible protein DinB
MTAETVTRVIDNATRHRERFEAFCRSLSKEQLSRPAPGSTWRVKDFIAHLATFDVQLIRWLEGAMAGDHEAAARNPDGSRLDIDAWNEAQAAGRRGWTLDRIFEEARANRARLWDCMQRLSEEQVGETWYFAGDSKRGPAHVPLKLFLLGWARHDPIHVADMIKALPERALDEEIRAWLDDPAVKWYQDAMR